LLGLWGWNIDQRGTLNGQRISCPEVDEFVFRTTHLVTDPPTAAMSAEAVQAGRLDACPTQATCCHGTLIRG